MKINYLKQLGLLSIVSLASVSCQNDNDEKKPNSLIDFNTSSMPALVIS